MKRLYMAIMAMLLPLFIWGCAGKKAPRLFGGFNLTDAAPPIAHQAQAGFHGNMLWLGFISVIGIGVSVCVALWSRSKEALYFAVGFAVILGLTLALTMYMKAAAIISIVVLCLGLVYMFRDQWLKGQAFKQAVLTAELAKLNLDPEISKQIFGTDTEPGIIHKIQSDSTKTAIERAKKKGLAKEKSAQYIKKVDSHSKEGEIEDSPK